MGPHVNDDSLYYHCILHLVRRPCLSGIHVFLGKIAATYLDTHFKTHRLWNLMGPQVVDDFLYYHCILHLVRRPSLSGIRVFLGRMAPIGVSFKSGCPIKSSN